MNTEIELQFSRKDFEEIYFQKNQGNYFKSPTTKNSFRNLLITFILLSLLTIYSIYLNNYGFVFYGSIIFSIFLFLYLRAFFTLKKWREEIKRYLDSVEKYSKHTITLTDEAIILVEDETETIQKWTAFKSATISSSFILLQGETSILIPSKSMSENSYAEAKSIISKKLRQSNEL